VNVFCTEYDIV